MNRDDEEKLISCFKGCNKNIWSGEVLQKIYSHKSEEFRTSGKAEENDWRDLIWRVLLAKLDSEIHWKGENFACFEKGEHEGWNTEQDKRRKRLFSSYKKDQPHE